MPSKIFKIGSLTAGLLLILCVVIANGQFGNKLDAKIKTKCSQGKEEVFGMGFLKKIPGQWSGPVTTSTGAGNFDNWYVDFRPVSAGQVSAYSTLDANTSNFLTFFIVRHDGKLKLAQRTEGIANGKGCVTYEVMDSVNESAGFYRFSDFQSHENRAYSQFTIKDDQFIMDVYTTKFNKVHPAENHAKWTAKLGSRKAAQEAIDYFKFPQPVMIKDFTDVFKNMPESIYYTFENDPYPSKSQPYVGTVTVNISIDEKLKVEKKHELFLMLTTESLFDGIKYNPDNLKYISRYVYLPVGTKSYTFEKVHPGKYYLYSYNDINNDKKHKTGDYMCSNVNNIVELKAEGSVTVDTKIDFVIP
jgi:hypothetical protein